MGIKNKVILVRKVEEAAKAMSCIDAAVLERVGKDEGTLVFINVGNDPDNLKRAEDQFPGLVKKVIKAGTVVAMEVAVEAKAALAMLKFAFADLE